MTETVAAIVLPPDRKLVKFDDAWRLTANALHPASGEESITNAVKRQICFDDHKTALRDAAKSGAITPLNPHTHVPVPEWEHAQLMRAVMTRADFERFAATLLIRVESTDAPPSGEPRTDALGKQSPRKETARQLKATRTSPVQGA